MIMMNPEDTQLYKIGAIARLTGITPMTIRMWQTRYDAVSPIRTEGKQRLYTEHDLTKLSLLKELTGHGDSIGMIAGLTVEELENRLKEQILKRGPREKKTNQTPIKTYKQAIYDLVFSRQDSKSPRIFRHNSAPWSWRGIRIGGNESYQVPGPS